MELDLRGNVLRAGGLDLPSLSASWVRGLNLSGNRMAAFPQFTQPFAKLLRLDLSFNRALSALPVNLGAMVPQLRELNLEGCDLVVLSAASPPPPAAADNSSTGSSMSNSTASAGGGSSGSGVVVVAGGGGGVGGGASSAGGGSSGGVVVAGTGFSGGGGASESTGNNNNALLSLRFLENVNLARNALGVRELAKVLQLRSLRRLSVHGNPGCDDVAFEAEVLALLPKKLPSLKSVDGVDTKLVGGRMVVVAMVAGGGGGGGGDGADGVMSEDAASCSCLEGNPCVVAYNCKDWTNRFEVARRHRQTREEHRRVPN